MLKMTQERLERKFGEYFNEQREMWSMKVEMPLLAGGYFITSERVAQGMRREYTIRKYDEVEQEIIIVGELMQYQTFHKARRGLLRQYAIDVLDFENKETMRRIERGRR